MSKDNGAGSAKRLGARFKAAKVASEIVTVDPGDGEGAAEVEVRELRGGQKAELLDRALDANGAHDGKLKLAVYQPALVSLASFYPGTDERVWPDPADAAMLPDSEFQKISEAAARLNRLDKASKHAGNSDSAAASAASSSTSPTS